MKGACVCVGGVGVWEWVCLFTIDTFSISTAATTINYLANVNSNLREKNSNINQIYVTLLKFVCSLLGRIQKPMLRWEGSSRCDILYINSNGQTY